MYWFCVNSRKYVSTRTVWVVLYPYGYFMFFRCYSGGWNSSRPPNFLRLARGVYYHNNWYFCPPPFSKIIFFPPSTVKISSYPPFFHLLPRIFTFFLINHYIFSPNYQKLIFLPPPLGGQNKKYTPLRLAEYKVVGLLLNIDIGHTINQLDQKIN